MEPLLLTGGAYQAKGIPANAQRCINLYPEINPEINQPPVPVTHYQTPGLDLLNHGDGRSSVRATYRATNGELFAVIGSEVYFINSAFQKILLGNISLAATPVSMVDNGLAIVIVDGGTAGYAIDMISHVFGVISGNNFYGANAVCFLDTFFIFNRPKTNQFYISLSNVTYAMLIAGSAFDALDIAAKTGYADNIETIVVIQGYIWLIGSLTSEIWYNSGAVDFAFQRLPGVNIIQHGAVSPYCASTQDLFPYWVSQDLQGSRVIIKGKNYQPLRISNHGIENLLSELQTVNDCISFIYQQEGHTFVFFVFPSGNLTIVYDEATEQWHQRCWTDGDGNLNRHRANCVANAYGKIVVGDWQNGNLYAFNLDTFTDNGAPISCIRSYPHSVKSFNRVSYNKLIANMEVGNDTGTIDGSTGVNPPILNLRYSDNRGVSYGNYLQGSLGAAGEYFTCIQYVQLGMARDRVFELSWSAPTKTSLQGAWIQFEEAET